MRATFVVSKRMGEALGEYQRHSERGFAPPPIFVGGMPRSGTTLLRVILDSHPNIACGPELRAIPALATLSRETRRLMGEMLAQYYCLPPSELDDVFAELVCSFLRPLHERSGKRRIAEKTPANALHFAELRRLFPDSPLIQVIRDGRDAVASVMQMDWTDSRTGKPLAVTQDPLVAAAAWAEHIARGREARDSGARYFEIRYEDIVRDARTALTPLFEFLEEPWSDDVLAYHSNSKIDLGLNEASAGQVSNGCHANSIGRWRNELGARERSAVKAAAGDLLIELGYANDFMW
jgi:hypothetical protein